MAREASGQGFELLRRLIAGLPGQLRAGYQAGTAIGRGLTSSSAPVFAFGMGGSGVAAALASSLVDQETRTVFQVRRDPSIPLGVGPQALCVFVSVSGDTQETLSAYRASGNTQAARVVVTSGGEIARLAQTDGVPVVTVPATLRPPRAAVGYLLGGLLGVLDERFGSPMAGRVEAAAAMLERRWPEFSGGRSVAARIAAAIGDRCPWFCSEESFRSVAGRAATQVNENAKRLAYFDAVPESFHNALVGWDAIRRREGSGRRVVLIEWESEDLDTRARFDYFKRLLRSRGVRALSLKLTERDRLAALLEGVVQGDLVSLFLAEKAGVEPTRVDAIDRMKSALSDVLRPPPAVEKTISGSTVARGGAEVA